MIYCFDDFELDLDQLQLRCAGALVPLQPQMFDVLRHLIEHRHRVVPKEELLDTVWGDRFVSESALSSRIKSIRQALGDDGTRQTYVRTAHGRGFQFVAEVSMSDRPAANAARRSRPIEIPASRFIGRDPDRAGVIKLLDERRLVTIWGTGGVGKTRLAVHVAGELAGQYSDGIHLVELATISSDQDVTRRICADLGVGEQDGREPLDRLVESFAGHHTLIVLDNCEHVVATVREIAGSLIAGTESVDVLATSRRPLGVDGEQLWSLAPLGLRTNIDTDIAPAVELFVDRVRSASPGLDLAGSYDTVESICQRLDGVPLLLELAAARVRHIGLSGVLDALTEPGLLDRLDDDGGRHRSVDAVIRWSYDLLDDEQRNVFGTLAVFPGWFDLDAASAIADCDARAVLWQLADQSLVTTDLSTRRPRYRLLEPLREFARRLDGPTPDVARARHVRYVVDTISDCDRRLRGPHGIDAMEHLVRLGDDAVVACSTMVADGDVERLARLATYLFVFANERMRGDLHAFIDRALEERPTLAEFPVPVAFAAVGAWQRGDLTGADRLIRRAIDIGDHDPGAAGIVHLVHAQVLQLSGDHAEAVAASLRSIEHCSDPILTTKAHAICALVNARRGHDDVAREHLRLINEIANASMAPLALAWSAYVEGELEANRHPDRALARLDAASTLAREAGSALVSGAAALSSTSLRSRSIDPAGPPLEEFASLIRHWQRSGNWAHQWVTLRNLVVVLAATNQPEAAATLYGAVTSAHAKGSAYGAEVDRLNSSMQLVGEQIGPERRDEFVTKGQLLQRADVISFALNTLRQGRAPASGSPVEGSRVSISTT